MDEETKKIIEDLKKRIEFLEKDHVSRSHRHNGQDSDRIRLNDVIGEYSLFLNKPNQ